jgi:transposase
MPARVSRKLHDRNEKLLPAIREIAWKGQIRLCTRYRRLAAPGKPKVVVTTAIAREMVGFIWAIARIAHSLTRPPAGYREKRPTRANPTVRTAGDRTAEGNPPALL